jgi:hypothetical protein
MQQGVPVGAGSNQAAYFVYPLRQFRGCII